MARWGVRILVGVLLLVGCAKYAYSSEALFVLACDQMEVDCTDLAPPKIVYLDPEDPILDGALGIYYGSDDPDRIFVRDDYTGLWMSEVIYHETIHYVQHHLGDTQIPNVPKLICPLEAQAFELSERFMNANLPEDKHVDYSNWYLPYIYCWPQYAPVFTP